MKKVLIMLLLFIFILCGCADDNSNINDEKTNNTETEQTPVNPEQTPVDPEQTPVNPDPTPVEPEEQQPIAQLNSYFKEEYADDDVNEASLNATRVFYNGDYLDSEKSLKNRNDIKYEFYSTEKLRFVNSSEGYALTIPTTEVEIDYSLSNYRVQLAFDDSILSASYEDSNPYGNTLGGWQIYL